MTRRTRLSMLSAVTTATLWASAALAVQSPQIPLANKKIPQFAQPLPLLSVAPGNGTINTVFGNQPLTLTMCEFDSNILPPGTIAPGVQSTTRTWGYIVGTTCPTTPQDTYLGPVIVNTRGAGPTTVTYVNNLGSAATTGVLAYKYSTDLTLHWADPQNLGCSMMGIPQFGSTCAQNYSGSIPAVPHLHGGEVPAEIDGNPDAWFTSDGAIKGLGYHTLATPGAPANSITYAYPNLQEAAPIWFHDHTLGATRLNVYAGLAGAYYIVDPTLNLPANLQPVNEVVPLVIQDRMFDTNGQLFFPADSAGGVLWSLNPDHPYWVPEFLGDTVVVNGKAWPFFSVQPKRYRFLVLNGSNARTYEMSLINQATGAAGPAMYVIATDGGFLDAPAKIDPALGQTLVVQPGERYEVIVDFAGFAGTNFVLRNTARTPYPKGVPPPGSTLGRVMQFRVAACAATGCPVDASFDPAAPGATLRSGTQVIQRLVNPATGTALVTPTVTRQLTLNEVMGMAVNAIDPVTGVMTAYPGGPLEILVNNSKWNGINHHTGAPIPGSVQVGPNWITEAPAEGTVEQWEIVNTTADAHPIHLHLVQFQLLSRQGYNTANYTKAYAAAFPGVPGMAMCPVGVFCPGYGPPLDYYTGNPRAVGGNPDITPFLQGPVMLPAPQEAGWKDTVMAPPGSVTRFLVRWAPTSTPTATPSSLATFAFDPSGGGTNSYVWHCHIIDHEDNEMMRPSVVRTNSLTPRTLLRNVNY